MIEPQQRGVADQVDEGLRGRHRRARIGERPHLHTGERPPRRDGQWIVGEEGGRETGLAQCQGDREGLVEDTGDRDPARDPRPEDRDKR